jgi:hypothetical protein
LVKEFIVNITEECNMEGSREHQKVYARGKYIEYSPTIINEYLGIDFLLSDAFLCMFVELILF